MTRFIRDLNRSWITFGQPSAFEVLMSGVREGNVEIVRVALKGGDTKPETLSAALVTASSLDRLQSDRHAEIRKMLTKAGAVLPPNVDFGTLQSYVGEVEVNRESSSRSL